MVEAAEAAGDTEAVEVLMGEYNKAPAEGAPPATIARPETPAFVPANNTVPINPETGQAQAYTDESGQFHPTVARIPKAGKTVGGTKEQGIIQTGVQGLGQSLDSTFRGGRQIFNYLTGDKEELAQLQAEEADRRNIDKELLGTASGRIGQIAGHVGMAMIPGGAAVKGSAALRAAMPLIKSQRARALLSTALVEGGIGAGQGALMPTVEGESRLDNAAEGAKAAAVMGMAPSLIKAAAQAKAPGITQVLPALARKLTGATETSARKTAGRVIGEVTESIPQVPLSPIKAELRRVRTAYGDELSPAAQREIDNMLGKTLPTTGTRIQKARAAFGAAGAEAKGAAGQGYFELTRILDDATALATSKRKAQMLRDAREVYTNQLAPSAPTTLKISGIAAANALRDMWDERKPKKQEKR